jgi:hypothetical protein
MGKSHRNLLAKAISSLVPGSCDAKLFAGNPTIKILVFVFFINRF